MNPLAKALAKEQSLYTVKPPWQSLKSIAPVRGNLMVVLAEPGGGKSAFSLNWAIKCGQPSLLLSLDTDLNTQAVRAAAIHSGRPMSRIKQNPELWSSYIDKHLSHVRAYDANVGMRELGQLIEAEAEYWGEPPCLTVVDNISNMIREGGYEEYRKLFNDLHRIARKQDTFIMALHHVTRKSGGKRITMTSGQYAGEQEAEIVLGLWEDPAQVMQVAFLKNRSGAADPQGRLTTPLWWEKDQMDIRDLDSTKAAMLTLQGLI